jgi:hypothetical protein
MDTVTAKKETFRALIKQFKSAENTRGMGRILSPYKAEIRKLHVRNHAPFTQIAAILKQAGVAVSCKTMGRFYRSYIQKKKPQKRSKNHVQRE